MRLTKIYTKIGDKGATSLASGAKVPKFSERIEAYGTVDELNAFIGQLSDHLPKNQEWAKQSASSLQRIQNELFDLGGELSTPPESLDIERQQVVSNTSVERLEAELDHMNNQLTPLANFVLPGGHPYVSFCHICRTICRRAERRVAYLASKEQVRGEIGMYLNRLSDWFFVLGRHVAKQVGAEENLWQQNK